MARTRKKFPWEWNSVFREPRGKTRAVRGKARKRSIPPDAWEDISYDKQCWLPQKVSSRLLRRGWNPYKVISHLVHHYGVSRRVAREVVELEEYGRCSWWPEGCVKVYKEERDEGHSA